MKASHIARTISLFSAAAIASAISAIAQMTPVASPAAATSVAPPMPTVTSEKADLPKGEMVPQTPENLRPGPALTALDPVPTSSAILGWMYDSREQQAASLEARIEATARAVEALKVSAGDYRFEAPFRSASMAISAAEDQLRKSIRAARTATSENWANLRAKVSADFKAYSDAVTRAEVLIATTAKSG